MAISLAYLGPQGTNTETAALAYARILADTTDEKIILHPCSSIAQTIQSVATKEANLAVAPVENSTEGSVTITLDTLWQLEQLKIQQELVLPIPHVFLSRGTSLQGIDTVYSHPQALAQCQRWLTHSLPKVKLIPTNSTTEALSLINQDPTSAAIASPRAAKLYDLPVLATNINDYPDNCTRFWVVGLNPNTVGNKITLGFSVPANVPGALVKPLQIFASKEINLSRIESRPTRRSLGEYLFFIDLEVENNHLTEEALTELATHTEILRVFGQYSVTPLSNSILSEL
ncbi:prephenate dehydratase [Chroococcus sp. FPU101]|uniref:prephenate dehydratase n=1 Tax=Chroococcus sp. FPU101 TaxID=1974212 RepID=UPI001A90299C|nr:prephenate dehydratase [Chroococcus sp. FPU101]GFE68172.1 Prephenate dehydratase [Chroococcus sp. FPU101]